MRPRSRRSIPSLFDEIFHLNVLAPIVAMQAVIPVMRAARAGAIVNVNSGHRVHDGAAVQRLFRLERALLGFSLTARAWSWKRMASSSAKSTHFITSTNFGKNRMGNPAGGGPASNYAAGDKPEFVAGLIVQAIEEGKAQYFASEQMRKMAGA